MDGAWLREKKACLDCLMIKNGPKGVAGADRIIHHIPWQRHLSSVGELISHIALARLWWFHKMGAPGAASLARQIAPWEGEKANTENLTEPHRWVDAIEQQGAAIVEHPTELLRWLEASW